MTISTATQKQGSLPMNWLFIANLGSTLIMVGVIWIVQVVHYPLFDQVGEATFRGYHADHNVLITYIVLPMMLLEAGTAALFILQRPSYISPAEAWIGLILVGIAWGTTFFMSVPQHGALAAGFNQQAYETLVNTNWFRTIAWSLRGVLVLWQVMKVLP